MPTYLYYVCSWLALFQWITFTKLHISRRGGLPLLLWRHLCRFSCVIYWCQRGRDCSKMMAYLILTMCSPQWWWWWGSGDVPPDRWWWWWWGELAPNIGDLPPIIGIWARTWSTWNSQLKVLWIQLHCQGSCIAIRCDKQHPRADQNTQHVFDEQHTRAGWNTQLSTKSKKLIK